MPMESGLLAHAVGVPWAVATGTLVFGSAGLVAWWAVRRNCHGLRVSISNELPGWTIEPNHAVTIHKHPGAYLTISGSYSLNTDGEGWNGVSTGGFGNNGHNANFYQDFESALTLNYTLSFNWQSWGLAYPPTTNHLKISVMDTVTGANG